MPEPLNTKLQCSRCGRFGIAGFKAVREEGERFIVCAAWAACYRRQRSRPSTLKASTDLTNP